MKASSLIIALLFISVASFAQGSQGNTIQGQLNDLKQRTVAKTTSITSGSATTLTTGSGPLFVVVNPASTLAAHSIKLPANAIDGQVVTMAFGGTVTSGTVVTALTISPATGQTILPTTPPTTATAGQSFAYRFYALLAKWYRLY